MLFTHVSTVVPFLFGRECRSINIYYTVNLSFHYSDIVTSNIKYPVL